MIFASQPALLLTFPDVENVKVNAPVATSVEAKVPGAVELLVLLLYKTEL